MLIPLAYCPKCNSVLNTTAFIFGEPVRYFYCMHCDMAFRRKNHEEIIKLNEEEMSSSLLGWIDGIRKFEIEHPVDQMVYHEDAFMTRARRIYRATPNIIQSARLEKIMENINFF